MRFTRYVATTRILATMVVAAKRCARAGATHPLEE